MTSETESNSALRWTNLDNAERKVGQRNERDSRSCRKRHGGVKRKTGVQTQTHEWIDRRYQRKKREKRTADQAETNRNKQEQEQETNPEVAQIDYASTLVSLSIQMCKCSAKWLVQDFESEYIQYILLNICCELTCSNSNPQDGTTAPQQHRSPTGLEKSLWLNHTCLERAAEKDG